MRTAPGARLPRSATPSRPLLTVTAAGSARRTTASAAAMPQAPASHGVFPSPKSSGGERDSSRKAGAAILAACSQIQSLPSWTSSDAAEMCEHEADQQHRDAVGDDRCQHDQRHQHSRPRCWESQRRANVRPPPPIDRREHQADGRGDPLIDRGDRDDVHIRAPDAGRGQRDCADPPAGTGVQPECDARRAPRRARPLRRHGFRAEDAGLGGEHEQQHDTDQRDRDTGDGEGLTDPVLRRAAAAAPWAPTAAGSPVAVMAVASVVRAAGTARWAAGRAVQPASEVTPAAAQQVERRPCVRRAPDQFGQFGRYPGQLLRHCSEFGGEPGDDGMMGCGHAGIVARSGAGG